MSSFKWYLGVTACLVATLSAFGVPDAAAADKKCLFVSSYHQGYAWSDGVERGLRSVLTGKCEIRQFDMNVKRRKSVEEQKEAALEAKAIIESWKPDVVIAADDAAAKYLIQPYYKDDRIPFVFCGVNWTAKEYGFPYSNVTGMIEVAPIMRTLELAEQIVPRIRRAFYIGADTMTEQKNLQRFVDASGHLGFQIDSALVGSYEAWLEAYERAQEADLVILGSNAGINDWNSDRIRNDILRLTRKLSVTNHEWMMPYTIIGVTKVPEEHGEWAGKTALAILAGASPGDIPIVPNNRRDIWVNTDIVQAANLSLPGNMMRKAKKVVQLDTAP